MTMPERLWLLIEQHAEWLGPVLLTAVLCAALAAR